MRLLEKISRVSNLAAERLLFVLGFSMALIVAIQVFSRYVLNHSLFWSEELARYMLVWLTFLGATVAYRRGAHPGIDILAGKLSPKLRKWTDLSVHVVSLILFFMMVYYGVGFAHFVRLQISPALQIPKWVIFSVVPISGLVLIFHAMVNTATTLGREKD